MEFGVQTFTVRREQKRGIKQAYLPLLQLGIKSFEVARIDFSERNAREIKAFAEEYGAKISAVQVKPKYVINSPEKIIGFCKITGCKIVVISMLPFKCILGSEKSFYSFVDSLDGLAERYAKEGITLAYHHHNWEYIKLSNGKSRMAELIERTEKIKFVHDTYWTARCGISPTRQIEAFSDRLIGIHLRDLAFRKKGIGVVSVDSAIGEGVVDFSELLEAARAVGCSYYVIEQKTKKPYSEIEKSLERLKEIERELGLEDAL